MNWENKTLFVGDNLHVLRGMNSETVDLIYLDPPFNSNRSYAAPIGSRAAGAAFKDAWTLSDIDLVEHQALKENHPGLYAVIDSVRCPSLHRIPTAIVRHGRKDAHASNPSDPVKRWAALPNLTTRLDPSPQGFLPYRAESAENQRHGGR